MTPQVRWECGVVVARDDGDSCAEVRLEVAKDVVKRFIAARTSDRIGVVAFAAEALTQVPLEVSSRQIFLHPAHWVVPLKFQKG